MSLVELAKKFAAHKSVADELKKQVDKNDEQWEKIEAEMIEQMITDGVPSIRLDNLGLFSLATSNYLSVNAANKPEFFRYLQESGHGSLLKLDVHAKTLESFLKAHVEELAETSKTSEGKDEFEARQGAVDFLIAKGAAHFKKQKIQFRKGP